MAANVKGPAKAKTAANSIVTAVAVIASLILLNIIMMRYPKRLDLTQEGVYSLSKYSLDLVKNLPDRMNVKLFVSDGLPPEFKPTAQYVRDLLDEYKVASGGKLDFEAIDPTAGKDDDEKKKHQEDLGKYKIQKITLERISDNKMEIGSENYLGVAFTYGEQIDSIPQIVRTEGLEYQVTGLIRRLIATKKKKIGIVTSEGELQPQQGLQLLGRILGTDYETTTVALDKPVQDDVDALFIVGPKTPFNDKSKYAIDQFLMKGKGVAFFVDGMKIEAPQGMQMPGMEQPKLGQPNDVNLQDLFEKYGLKLHDDIVFDAQNAPGLVPVQGQMFPANYPTFVAIAGDGLAKNDLTHNMGAIVMPFASSLELVGDLKDGKSEVKAQPVARTSARSWRNTGFFVFNPLVKLEKPQNEADKGPFTLGYTLQGKWKSAYPNGAPGSEPGTSMPENAGALKESPPDTRFVIMASSGMLDDHQLPYQLFPGYLKNLQFAANAADWLTKDDALMSLRAKGMTQRPFVPASDSRATFWRWFIQTGVPALFVGLGLLLFWLRSARRAAASIETL